MQTQSLTRNHIPGGLPLPSWQVSAVGPFHRFGTRLHQERVRRPGWSLARVVGKLQRSTRALETLSPPQLMDYEAGTVKRPDPLVIWHLAIIYGIDHLSLLRALQDDREEQEQLADAAAEHALRKLAVGESPPTRPLPTVRGRRRHPR